MRLSNKLNISIGEQCSVIGSVANYGEFLESIVLTSYFLIAHFGILEFGVTFHIAKYYFFSISIVLTVSMALIGGIAMGPSYYLPTTNNEKKRH